MSPSYCYYMPGAVLFGVQLSSTQQSRHGYSDPCSIPCAFPWAHDTALSKTRPWLPEVHIVSGRLHRTMVMLAAWEQEPLWVPGLERWVWVTHAQFLGEVGEGTKNKCQIRMEPGSSQNLQGGPCTCWCVIQGYNSYGVVLKKVISGTYVHFTVEWDHLGTF